MEVLWVHLQKFCSGPLKWHRLSQSGSSEKQPKMRNKQTWRMKKNEKWKGKTTKLNPHTHIYIYNIMVE